MFDFSAQYWFGAKGPLACTFSNYQVRQEQIEMADAVSQALDKHELLVAEAGTGTGKTWAYLLPSLVSGKKIIVSTGTIALQDQIYYKDIPALKKVLGLPINVKVLKGRTNYVCLRHLEVLSKERAPFRTKEEVKQFHIIRIFAQKAVVGDKAHCKDIPEDAPIWTKVTCPREKCLYSQCEYYKDCFVMKARKEAQEADVVIINHSLFFANQVLIKRGQMAVLPEADAVIFDEAHQIPDVATQFLGQLVTTYQLRDFAEQMRKVGLQYAKDAGGWIEDTELLLQAGKELRLFCSFVDDYPSQRILYQQIPQLDGLLEQLNCLSDLLAKKIEKLQQHIVRHPEVENCYHQGQELLSKIQRWTSNEEALTTIRWIETSQQSVRFFEAPLSVYEVASYKRYDQAWILTSATIGIRKNINHFTQKLGFHKVNYHYWESPFDYESNALLYVPEHSPLPQETVFSQYVTQMLLPFVKSTQGGVMVLTTTLRAIQSYRDQLIDLLDKEGLDRPVLYQGQMPRAILLQEFKNHPGSILIGSASFWEGVDFPGHHLTVLLIDKLPFAAPDDPVLKARTHACEKSGGKPFFELQIPSATIALKQGAGRLIRTENDYGVLIVADRRLVDKTYGRLLWQSLPPFKRSRVMEEALAFLKSHEVTQSAQ